MIMKNLLAIFLLAMFIIGGNAMANALNDKQQSVAEMSAYAALGNQDGLNFIFCFF